MGRFNTERAGHHYQYVVSLSSLSDIGKEDEQKIADQCEPTPPVYRVNTFPLIHRNVLHTIFNILALTPLLERFETEFGTLTSLALFFGRQYTCHLQPATPVGGWKEIRC
jgi:membrane associated rhomboid family serine protease